MDVTEVALHQVTDDFLGAHPAMGDNWDLDQVTEFLVIAATLLDLKAARLLPAPADETGHPDDDMFQARDLLFARLLAYRAYQQVAALFAELEAGALRRYPRAVTLEARYLGLLPEVTIGLTPEQFADHGRGGVPPKPPADGEPGPHPRAAGVGGRAHRACCGELLADRGTATFGELVAGCTATLRGGGPIPGPAATCTGSRRWPSISREPLGDADRAVDRLRRVTAVPTPDALPTDGRGVRVTRRSRAPSTAGTGRRRPPASNRVPRPTVPTEPEVVPEHDLAGALEAVLLVVDTPVTEAALGDGGRAHRPAHVRELLAELADRYTAANSGIELREFGGGWRFYTRDRFAPVVERFVLDGAQSRLSRAALETLAVVAYRQPVTRARIAAVRGVNVDGVIRTLMSRGLIEDVRASTRTPAALLYRTTDLFLERLGLSRPDRVAVARSAAARHRGIDDV